MRLLKLKEVDVSNDTIDKYYVKNEIITNGITVKEIYTLDMRKILHIDSIFELEKPVSVEEILPDSLKIDLSLNGKFCGYYLLKINNRFYIEQEAIIRFDYYAPEMLGYVNIYFTNIEEFTNFMEKQVKNGIIRMDYDKKNYYDFSNFNELKLFVEEYFKDNINGIIYGE